MQGWEFSHPDAQGIGYWVKRRAELTPTAMAVRDVDNAFTWHELNRRINRLAAGLANRGVRFGDRVSALLLNSVPFLETLFACAKLGAVFVPLNFRLSAPEVAYILGDSGTRWLIHHQIFGALAEAACQGTAVTDRIAVANPGVVQENPYESWLCAQSDQEPGVVVRAQDIHVMMYTSGTTGRPKGAMLSHRNATWNAIHLMLHDATLKSGDVVLTVAPLFHIGGLGVHTLPALYQGLPVVLLPRFDPKEVMETIQRDRISALFMVPSMWMALSEMNDFDSYDLSSLRLLLSGGAPCPIPVIEFFHRRGFNFLEGFGMTETSPSAMVLASHDAIRKHGSIGQPVFHQEAMVVDEDDQPVSPGTVGELVLRGPNIFEGYWNNPEATRTAFRGGWFHTGDLARQDNEGFFYLVDRKKDMVISGGENVYPVEVEQVLVRHPKVREVAVIGAPDARWGEVPMAVIVPVEPDSPPTVDDIDAFCKGRLARFKIPKRVIVVDELPRNATGKVLKTVLRSRYGTPG